MSDFVAVDELSSAAVAELIQAHLDGAVDAAQSGNMAGCCRELHIVIRLKTLLLERDDKAILARTGRVMRAEIDRTLREAKARGN